MATQPAALLASALGSRLEPPGDPVSERILDAALALAAASGLRHLTMDDVARRAGVGRMTVYRRFGDRARLVEALAVRESRRCLAELDTSVDPEAPIADQVADGFVASLRIARDHPLLNRLARVEPDSMLAGLLAAEGAVFGAARAAVVARLRDAQRRRLLGPVPLEPAAELVVRLALSFVLIQDSALPLDDEPRLRELATQLIAPVLSPARAG